MVRLYYSTCTGKKFTAESCVKRTTKNAQALVTMIQLVRRVSALSTLGIEISTEKFDRKRERESQRAVRWSQSTHESSWSLQVLWQAYDFKRVQPRKTRSCSVFLNDRLSKVGLFFGSSLPTAVPVLSWVIIQYHIRTCITRVESAEARRGRSLATCHGKQPIFLVIRNRLYQTDSGLAA